MKCIFKLKCILSANFPRNFHGKKLDVLVKLFASVFTGKNSRLHNISILCDILRNMPADSPQYIPPVAMAHMACAAAVGMMTNCFGTASEEELIRCKKAIENDDQRPAVDESADRDTSVALIQRYLSDAKVGESAYLTGKIIAELKKAARAGMLSDISEEHGPSSEVARLSRCAAILRKKDAQ